MGDHIPELADNIQELAGMIVGSSRPPEDGWCRSIVVDEALCSGKSVKHVTAGMGPARCTERGEFLWVNLNLNGRLPGSLLVRDLLKVAVEPLLKGRWNLIIEDTKEGFVVVLADKRKEVSAHGNRP